MLRPIRLLTLAAAATCCGCSYLQNRTNDLLDVFRFDVGHGPGLYADARVTDFFASGLGLRSQRTAGMHGRFGFTLAEVGNSGLGIFVLAEHKPWHPTPLLPDSETTMHSATARSRRTNHPTHRRDPGRRARRNVASGPVGWPTHTCVTTAPRS